MMLCPLLRRACDGRCDSLVVATPEVGEGYAHCAIPEVREG